MDEFFDYGTNHDEKKHHQRTIKQLERFLSQEEDEKRKKEEEEEINEEQKDQEVNQEKHREKTIHEKKAAQEKQQYKKTTSAPTVHNNTIQWFPTIQAPKTIVEEIRGMIEKKQDRQQDKWERIAVLKGDFHFPVILGEASQVFPLERTGISLWEEYEAATKAHPDEEFFSCAPHLGNTFVLHPKTSGAVPIFIRRRARTGQLAEVRILFSQDDEQDDKDDTNAVKLD